MKDNLQNISDLIGALAEDIEEIKKILVTKDASDKNEAVKRLASAAARRRTSTAFSGARKPSRTAKGH